jgi:hypothetical protein
VLIKSKQIKPGFPGYHHHQAPDDGRILIINNILIYRLFS